MNSENGGCKFELHTSTRSDILYLFGQEIFFFYQAENEEILKSDVCGNHVRHAT